MLKRTVIREIIGKVLLNKTEAKWRVYDSLPFPVAQDECPCILIYTAQENGQTRGRHIALFETSLQIDIEVRVAGQYSELAKQIDTICEQIEDLLFSSDEFMKEIEAVSSVNTKFDFNDGGDQAFAIGVISVTVEYKKEIAPKPDGFYLSQRIDLDAIDPYDPNRASIGPDGRIEATAIIDVPQT